VAEEKHIGSGELDDSRLPPDGTIIRANEKRRQVLWVPVIIYALLGIYVIGFAIDRGSLPAAAVGVVIFGGVVALSVQTARNGIVLSSRGIKARGWRTRKWSWEEIDHFELRERGQRPRFLVHLRNGESHGVVGFFGRSEEEEERAQRLHGALAERLRIERSRIGQSSSAST
jgi:hypothetical protein